MRLFVRSFFCASASLMVFSKALFAQDDGSGTVVSFPSFTTSWRKFTDPLAHRAQLDPTIKFESPTKANLGWLPDWTSYKDADYGAFQTTALGAMPATKDQRDYQAKFYVTFSYDFARQTNCYPLDGVHNANYLKFHYGNATVWGTSGGSGISGNFMTALPGSGAAGIPSGTSFIWDFIKICSGNVISSVQNMNLVRPPSLKTKVYSSSRALVSFNTVGSENWKLQVSNTGAENDWRNVNLNLPNNTAYKTVIFQKAPVPTYYRLTYIQ